MKEIVLNQAKSLAGKDFSFEKLEIPVTLPTAGFMPSQPNISENDKYPSPQSEKVEELPFLRMQVNQMMLNSNVQLSMSQCHGDTELMVALQGPSDLRGFKQDPAKAVVELTIKDLTSKEGQICDAYNMESLRSELRSMLEEVIQLAAYPKCILTLQVFITKREAPVQLFAACANGLLAAINQAGIHMKTAPCAAVTVAVRLNDMADDESVNIELIECPRTY